MQFESISCFNGFGFLYKWAASLFTHNQPVTRLCFVSSKIWESEQCFSTFTVNMCFIYILSKIRIVRFHLDQNQVARTVQFHDDCTSQNQVVRAVQSHDDCTSQNQVVRAVQFHDDCTSQNQVVRTVQLFDDYTNQNQAARRFNVRPSVIWRLLRLFRQTGLYTY